MISGTSVLRTITDSSFACPQAPLFDPAAGLVAVPNSCGSTVSFINSTGSVVAVVPVGVLPISLGYDPHFSTLLVANAGSNSVTILGADNLTRIGDAGVGKYPIAVAFDPATQLDYVTNGEGTNVTVFNGLGQVHSSINLGKAGALGAHDIGWSQKVLELYVADFDHNVSVIQGHSVVRTLQLPSGTNPGGVAYDDFNGHVYVTSLSGNVLYVYS